MAEQTEAHAIRDVEGVVRAVEIDDDGGGRFKLLLDNGDTLTAPFTSKDDLIITQALREHRMLRLRVVGKGEYDIDGKPRRILRLEWCELNSEFSRSLKARVAAKMEQAEQKPDAADMDVSLPIWKKIAAIGKSAPKGTWDDVPTDGSINYKRYLYGYPKRELEE